MHIVLIGVQGSGKSSQGNLLSDKHQIPYLSSGHIFRQMAKEKTPMGRLLKETINSGALVSDEMTLNVVLEYLKKPEYANGYILDGFPRTLAQAETFNGAVDKVVFLDVSDKEALWRIAGRNEDREDTSIQAIRKRIDLFHQCTVPVIDYYRTQNKLIEINGEQDIAKVFTDICTAIES